MQWNCRNEQNDAHLFFTESVFTYLPSFPEIFTLTVAAIVADTIVLVVVVTHHYNDHLQRTKLSTFLPFILL